MTIGQILKNLNDRFGGKILNMNKGSDKRVYVDIYPKDINEIVRYLFKEAGLRFNTASGVDDFDSLEILYHFSDDSSGIVVSLRALIKDKQDPHVDTITNITRSAWWIERELHELFGIEFNGNSDLRPLLLPDDWPKGVYPMRKDFVPPKRDSRKEDK
ncbi:MAG: NADH-quinone oxidoreductase subunit C [Candidatus Omnitrophota bacterium]|nr:NADH-quinone oxidoreductase subunit C [Candidatus Omnitrophota bacterium]